MYRTSGENLTSRKIESEEERRRDSYEFGTRWLDGIKKACKASLLDLGDAKVICMDRERLTDFVNCAYGDVIV